MKLQETVAQPQLRSAMRRRLGREYFIVKRRLKWLLGKEKYASVQKGVSFDNSLIQHRSFLLRPLKDVDMVLQHNKVKNLTLAIRHINQVVIHPGETFSIWKLVGRPSKSKGYLDGLVLSNGKIGRGTGGGLCQLGNLLYWMALHSPLTIRERWRHGYDVFPDINRNIPFACGATLSYNYIDLQLYNGTDQSFQLLLWLDQEYLHGEITSEKECLYSYSIYETDHQIQHQWWGAYTRHNRIWKRSTLKSDQSITEELVAENNAIMMYNPLLESGK